MPRTPNENLISATQAERLSVTLDPEQLVKDNTAQSMFLGDGTSAGGRAHDVRTVSEITGTTYTIVRGDESKLIRLTSSSAKTITIPTNASVAFHTDKTRIVVLNTGSGNATIAGATGVTVSGQTTVEQFKIVELFKTGTNTWIAVGANDTSDDNTTYSISVPSSTTSIRLTGNDSSTDDIALTAGSNVTLTRTSDSEISIASTDTNTQLSQDEVEDFVAGLLTAGSNVSLNYCLLYTSDAADE